MTDLVHGRATIVAVSTSGTLSARKSGRLTNAETGDSVRGVTPASFLQLLIGTTVVVSMCNVMTESKCRWSISRSSRNSQ